MIFIFHDLNTKEVHEKLEINEVKSTHCKTRFNHSRIIALIYNNNCVCVCLGIID